MPITVESHPLSIASRPGMSVVATVDGSDPEALDSLLDAIEAALAGHGLGLADVVRTRLHAATRAGRGAASRVRFRRLAGPARCATSSYIDPSVFGSGDGVRLATIALSGTRQTRSRWSTSRRSPPAGSWRRGTSSSCPA